MFNMEELPPEIQLMIWKKAFDKEVQCFIWHKHVIPCIFYTLQRIKT